MIDKPSLGLDKMIFTWGFVLLLRCANVKKTECAFANKTINKVTNN